MEFEMKDFVRLYFKGVLWIITFGLVFGLVAPMMISANDDMLVFLGFVVVFLTLPTLGLLGFNIFKHAKRLFAKEAR